MCIHRILSKAIQGGSNFILSLENRKPTEQYFPVALFIYAIQGGSNF